MTDPKVVLEAAVGDAGTLRRLFASHGPYRFSDRAFDDIFVAVTQSLEVISMDVLKKLFEQHFHSPVARVQPLQGQLGGSGRKIIRLASEQFSAIGILYDVREENIAFLEFSRHFRRHGLPVPEIYAEDLSHGAYLEEDLGDTTLFEFLSNNRAARTLLPRPLKRIAKLLPCCHASRSKPAAI